MMLSLQPCKEHNLTNPLWHQHTDGDAILYDCVLCFVHVCNMFALCVYIPVWESHV